LANRIKELGGLSVGAGSGPVEGIKPAHPAGAAGAGAGNTSTSADSVHITPHARLLTSLSQAVQNAPEVDAARVTNLQQAIESGQYRVDPEQTATRLMRLEQDLGETQRR
jgi:negative regulator of flagellin synthesis FlgM